MQQKLNRIPVFEIQSAFSRTGLSCFRCMLIYRIKTIVPLAILCNNKPPGLLIMQ